VQGWVLARADRPARGRLLRCGRPRHAAPPPPPLMLLSASNWCAMTSPMLPPQLLQLPVRL